MPVNIDNSRSSVRLYWKFIVKFFLICCHSIIIIIILLLFSIYLFLLLSVVNKDEYIGFV